MQKLTRKQYVREGYIVERKRVIWASVASLALLWSSGNTFADIYIVGISGQNIIAFALPITNSPNTTPAIPILPGTVKPNWVACPVGLDPSDNNFQLGGDPHTVTAYQAPDGTFHAIALLSNSAANELARVDLTNMLNPQIVPRDPSGHFCTSPLSNPSSPLTNISVVTFIPFQ